MKNIKSTRAEQQKKWKMSKYEKVYRVAARRDHIGSIWNKFQSKMPLQGMPTSIYLRSSIFFC